MTAWQNLLAASSLSSGSAWDLLANPNAGGSTVYVDQINSAAQEYETLSEVGDDQIQSLIGSEVITSTISVTDTSTELSDNSITVSTE